MIEWRDIENFPGYQVSNTGLVRSLDREVVDKNGAIHPLKGKLLKPWFSTNGYAQCDPCKSGKHYRHPIHRLVAHTFIGRCPDGSEVCHGVGGRLDNSVENLSYGTKSQNKLDMYRDGTMPCKPVRRSDGVVFRSVSEAAEATNSHPSCIRKVCNGKRKHAKGYTFEFI